MVAAGARLWVGVIVPVVVLVGVIVAVLVGIRVLVGMIVGVAVFWSGVSVGVGGIGAWVHAETVISVASKVKERAAILFEVFIIPPNNT